jgi:hypothetical protein
VRGPLGLDVDLPDLFPMCRGDGMAGMAGELEVGGGGAGRIGWKRVGWYTSSADGDVLEGVVWQ